MFCPTSGRPWSRTWPSRWVVQSSPRSACPTWVWARPRRLCGDGRARGTRGCITWATLGRALLIPVVWVAYTLVRGTFAHQYPYGFVNVWRLGYAQVAINIVAILIGALLFMALFAGADWLIRTVSQQK